MTENSPGDIRKKAEVDRLLTAAWVERRRGDYVAAERLAVEALEADPADLDAQEFAADIIYARGDLKAAAKHYKAIWDADPARAAAEEKYAKAVVEIAEGERQQLLLQDMLLNPKKNVQPEKNPTLAAIISIAPGFGQIYCGQLARGIVMFCHVIVAWFIVSLIAPASPPSASDAQKAFNFISDPWVVAISSFATFTHLYAIIDASNIAQKMGRKG